MKKLTLLFFAVACITLTSCFHHDRDISITCNDADHYYSMNAYFSRSKTRDVERYMNRKIGGLTSISFINTTVDGQIALDDHTTFYIKKYPGYLKIKLNKDENSGEAYERIKEMCEGVKKVLAHEHYR